MKEYRVCMQQEGRTLKTWTKRDQEMADKDLDQLLTEREDGKLSDFWDEAEIFMEAREVGEWERVSST